MLYVYTDGSYSSNMPDKYSGAFLVYAGTQCIYSDAGCGTKAVSMRNVAGELSAVMHAALWLRSRGLKGTIVYDYTGVHAWLNGNWRTKNEFTKAYKKFMNSYVEDGTVSFKWVKAHDGDLGNHQADELAKLALRQGVSWKK